MSNFYQWDHKNSNILGTENKSSMLWNQFLKFLLNIVFIIIHVYIGMYTYKYTEVHNSIQDTLFL